MNLAEWRARRQGGEDATLPSGLEIRVRKVSIMDLVEQGQIPQTLKPKIDEMIQKQGAIDVVSSDQLKESGEILNLVCQAVIVGPEGLDVTELPYEDRVAVFQWANEGSTRLKTFRAESTGAVGAGRAGAEVRTASEFATGFDPD